MNLWHRHTVNGYLCPVTGKTTDFTWSDPGKPGSGNSCWHCTGEDRTAGQMLRAADTARATADGPARRAGE